MKKHAGQKEIIKKVLEYIRPQWFRVLLSLLMAVSFGGADLISAGAYRTGCGSYFRTGQGRIY